MRKIGPAWTIEGKRKEEKLPQVPGPGSYETRGLSKSPGFTLTKSNRNNSKSPENPGPGAYDSKTITKSRSAVFGSSARMAKVLKSEGPGPGLYEEKSWIIKGPKYSLKGRVKKTEPPAIPGPGAYNTNTSCLDKTFAHIFSTEKKRNHLGNDESPGPCAYNPRQELSSTGVKIGSEKRIKTEAGWVPGPGSYNLPEMSNAKGFSLVGKVSVKETERSPGPGNYYVKTYLDNKGFTIGRSYRFLYEQSQVPGPGPGSYNEEIPKNSGFSVICKSKRDMISPGNDFPGPGSYNVSRFASEGPAFSFRTKAQTKPPDQSPGPAEYNLRISEKVNAPGFGTAKKGQSKVDENPGPGQYSTPEKKYSNWAFGREVKLKCQVADVPGPGSYDIGLF